MKKNNYFIKKFFYLLISFFFLFTFCFNTSNLTNINYEASQNLATVNSVNSIPTKYLKLTNNEKNLEGFADGVTPFVIRDGRYNQLVIPNSVETISPNAFFSVFDGLANYVNTVVFGQNLKNIGAYAFYGCSGITNTLDFEKTQLESVGSFAFFGCRNVKNLKLPLSDDSNNNTLKVIGNSAFGSCSGITGTLCLPSSIERLGDYAFDACDSLDYIDFSEYAFPPRWLLETAFAFRHCGKSSTVEDRGVLVNAKNISTADWSKIFDSQLGNDGLKVTPAHATHHSDSHRFFRIEDQGFTYLGSDEKITLKTITGIIDASVFNYDVITIPADVEAISSLSNVTTGKSITSYPPFRLEFESSTETPASLVFIAKEVFKDSKITGDLIFPKTLAHIGQSAFENCSNLTSVELPTSESWEIIQDAFKNTGIRRIVCSSFSDKYSLGEGAFGNCEYLSFLDFNGVSSSGISWSVVDGRKPFSGKDSATGSGVVLLRCSTIDQNIMSTVASQLAKWGFKVKDDQVTQQSFYYYGLDNPPEGANWLIAEVGNSINDSDGYYYKNQKKKLCALRSALDFSKIDGITIPNETSALVDELFVDKFCPGTDDEGKIKNKTWIFDFGFGTYELGDRLLGDTKTPVTGKATSGLLFNNHFPSSIGIMNNIFAGPHGCICGFVDLPMSLTTLKNFDISGTQIFGIKIYPNLKNLILDTGVNTFNSSKLSVIDLTSLNLNDFKNANWSKRAFEKIPTGGKIYVSSNVSDWETYLKTFDKFSEKSWTVKTR